MINNNHKNSGCGFAGELVSYVYGEIGGAQKSTFESHLAGCSICADELAAFAGVHFAINDWKTQEFAHLETPLIEIPSAKNEPAAAESKGSWLAGLRDLFSNAPRAWSLAAASLAILAVTVGIVLYAVNSRGRGGELAESNNIKLPATAPTVEKSPVPAAVNNKQSDPANESVKPVNKESKTPPETATNSAPNASRIVRTSTNPRPAAKPDAANAPKAAPDKRNNKNNQKAAPKAGDDEDDDDTLRLAEIFDEIETK